MGVVRVFLLLLVTVCIVSGGSVRGSLLGRRQPPRASRPSGYEYQTKYFTQRVRVGIYKIRCWGRGSYRGCVELALLLSLT